MKKLIMTIGLPRSGKSTWAMAQTLPVVNPDSIRLAIHGQAFYGPAEPLVWSTAKVMVRSLFIAGHQTVILDATNLTVDRRKEWFSGEYVCEPLEFRTPIEVCIQRATDGGRLDLVPVILRMAERMEWPND